MNIFIVTSQLLEEMPKFLTALDPRANSLWDILKMTELENLAEPTKEQMECMALLAAAMDYEEKPNYKNMLLRLDQSKVSVEELKSAVATYFDAIKQLPESMPLMAYVMPQLLQDVNLVYANIAKKLMRGGYSRDVVNSYLDATLPKTIRKVLFTDMTFKSLLATISSDLQGISSEKDRSDYLEAVTMGMITRRSPRFAGVFLIHVLNNTDASQGQEICKHVSQTLGRFTVGPNYLNEALNAVYEAKDRKRLGELQMAYLSLYDLNRFRLNEMQDTKSPPFSNLSPAQFVDLLRDQKLTDEELRPVINNLRNNYGLLRLNSICIALAVLKDEPEKLEQMTKELLKLEPNHLNNLLSGYHFLLLLKAWPVDKIELMLEIGEHVSQDEQVQTNRTLQHAILAAVVRKGLITGKEDKVQGKLQTLLERNREISQGTLGLPLTHLVGNTRMPLEIEELKRTIAYVDNMDASLLPVFVDFCCRNMSAYVLESQQPSQVMTNLFEEMNNNKALEKIEWLDTLKTQTLRQMWSACLKCERTHECPFKEQLMEVVKSRNLL
ncbi:hypothetical protein Ciccas_003629 [Cichlidogyrus casuarinus]|uniref:Uncharacterized protein n=1 Tax=Cichlidogyrus casuarinus TaxID=1844966 RepID=A0ABD2QDU3_9PLAT